MDLFNEIQELCQELKTAVKQLSHKGILYADAYRKYRMLLSKKLFELKERGMPVTIAYDIARGYEEVANAKHDELATEAIYKACLENIQAIKLQIKVIQNQYDKEYGITGTRFDNN